MAPDELGRLRKELAGYDGAIARAVAARLRVAKRIGDAKRVRGRPIRNRAVERQVLRRWAEEFESIGVPKDRAHAFARWLVEEAVRVQELSRGPRPGPRYRVVIAGGAGGMGRLLGDRLRAIGHDVRVVDPAARRRRVGPHPVEPDLALAAAGADYVLVATPISAAASVYRALWRSGTRATVVDILSVKAPIRHWIAVGRRAGYRVSSAHPLFGPNARTVSGELVLLVDCGDTTANARTAALLRTLGVVVERVRLRDHDRWMADLQVLPRLAGLSFLLAHDRGGPSARRARGIVTPSFRRQYDVSERLLRESTALSFAIQSENPHAMSATERFVEGVEELRALLRRNGGAAYRARLEQLRSAAAPRSRRAKTRLRR